MFVQNKKADEELAFESFFKAINAANSYLMAIGYIDGEYVAQIRLHQSSDKEFRIPCESLEEIRFAIQRKPDNKKALSVIDRAIVSYNAHKNYFAAPVLKLR